MCCQFVPKVAVGSGGDFVVAWQSYPGLASSDVEARRFDAGGTPLGNQFQVNTYTTGDQEAPAIASGSDGSFVVTWQSIGQDGSGGGIFAQRYDGGGAPLGGEFQVNTGTLSNQYAPAIDVKADGTTVIGWTGSPCPIRTRRFLANGTAMESDRDTGICGYRPERSMARCSSR